MRKGSKIFLIFLIICLIVAIAGLGYYCYTLNQKIEKIEEKSDTKNEENNKSDSSLKEQETNKDEKVSYTLFNTAITIDDICPTKIGICDKEIGTFSLNDKTYTASLSYDMDDTGEHENYLMLGSSKVDIMYLKKIIKINDNYLAVEVSYPNDWHTLYIYDENLNIIKKYADAGSEFEINKNVIKYYKHSFAISEDENMGDNLPNYNELHTITIENGIFNEKITKESF